MRLSFRNPCSGTAALRVQLDAHGGAQLCDVAPPSAETGSLATLTREQVLVNVKHTFSQDSACFDAGLPAKNRLDFRLLLDWPDVYPHLVHSFALCDMRPPDLKQHLQHQHRDLWESAERCVRN